MHKTALLLAAAHLIASSLVTASIFNDLEFEYHPLLAHKIAKRSTACVPKSTVTSTVTLYMPTASNGKMCRPKSTRTMTHTITQTKTNIHASLATATNTELSTKSEPINTSARPKPVPTTIISSSAVVKQPVAPQDETKIETATKIETEDLTVVSTVTTTTTCITTWQQGVKSVITKTITTTVAGPTKTAAPAPAIKHNPPKPIEPAHVAEPVPVKSEPPSNGQLITINGGGAGNPSVNSIDWNLVTLPTYEQTTTSSSPAVESPVEPSGSSAATDGDGLPGPDPIITNPWQKGDGTADWTKGPANTDAFSGRRTETGAESASMATGGAAAASEPAPLGPGVPGPALAAREYTVTSLPGRDL